MQFNDLPPFFFLPGLGKTEMFQLAEIAIDFIFADDGVKADLRATFKDAVKKLNL